MPEVRLIDANALIDDLKESAKGCREWKEEAKDEETRIRAEQARGTFIECALRAKNAPTIELKRGEWIVYTEFFETVCNLCSKIKMAKCSCCGHTAQYANFLSVTMNKKELPEFCPNCGAEMSVKMKEDGTNTAKWIPTEYDSYADGAPVWDKWECSKCGHEHSGEEDTLTSYCPNCGAKMGGADNE